ncbi:hypothetical protein SDC9_22902 [bioreactor metagenome]|uniref:Uncharacterized protein n=1 Tax=bioreactor metagenome TaxID=1076179 RepID=A0A644UDW5_9ZZZZ|nr:hypothetical protein [Negativicutes bacterium]
MTSQRILLIGGLLLFLSGLAYSLFYHIILNAINQHSLLYNLDMAFNMTAKGDFETASAFAIQYRIEAAAHQIHSRIPLQLMLTGLLSAPLLIASQYIEASERLQQIFALLIVLGGFILASGEIITVYGPEHGGNFITVGGYSWIFFGLLGYVIYTALYMWLHDTPKINRAQRAKAERSQ